MLEVMIDLETLSVRPDSAILIIAAIKFDRNEKWSQKAKLVPKEEQSCRLIEGVAGVHCFYKRIDLLSCLELGMRISPETQAWWSTQDENIRKEAFGPENRIVLKEALKQFSEWFGDSKLIWGHGDDFDCTILGEAYERCSMEKPWKFWNTRDTRTLFDLASVRMSDLPTENKHHALYDCYRQIIGVQLAIKKLNL